MACKRCGNPDWKVSEKFFPFCDKCSVCEDCTGRQCQKCGGLGWTTLESERLPRPKDPTALALLGSPTRLDRDLRSGFQKAKFKF